MNDTERALRNLVVAVVTTQVTHTRLIDAALDDAVEVLLRIDRERSAQPTEAQA